MLNGTVPMAHIDKEDERDGWVDASKRKPAAYDLVHLKKDWKTASVPGWWNGTGWSGLRVREHLRYEFWKKCVHA